MTLLIHYLLPAFPLGGIYFLLNIPLFSLGWKYVGRRFFMYSIVGMIIFSAAIETIKVTLPMHDNILCALLAGIITGAGAAIVLKSDCELEVLA